MSLKLVGSAIAAVVLVFTTLSAFAVEEPMKSEVNCVDANGKTMMMKDREECEKSGGKVEETK